jgi:hypothetical protein
VNIGLESGRDKNVFDYVTASWKTDPACKTHQPVFRIHPGIIHGLIMVTGQIEAAFFYMQ